MFMSATTATRRRPASHQSWKAHPYQSRAVEFLCSQNAAALFLDPGLGKTAITLASFIALKESRVADRMLVIAPLRVVQTVWQQEAQKWTEFRHLKFSVLHGPNKKQRLKDDADIWLINPEGCDWLAKEFYGRSLPFDTVVIDELTKFKNHRAVRSKSLRPRLRSVKRRWGLTGTPIPNGYLDLFGQFLMLDDGAALEKYVTHYRDLYFTPDFNGFDYVLQPGAGTRIEKRIEPYVLRMAAEDYLDLPPLVDDVRYVDLEPPARVTYQKMKKDMLAELPEGIVTGANSAAVYSKLKQMANGAVYLGDGPTRQVASLHDAKLDALSELVEELCGQPVLVAYEFNHDLARLQARFPNAPYIGSGVSGAKLKEIVDAWNAGSYPVLFAHPASAGHGLNLQGSGAGHIAWFGPVWDLELYEQFIQRVHRQGTTAGRVINHIFVARETIDELVMGAVKDKATTQERLLQNLTSELIGDVARALASTIPTRAELEAQPVRIMHPDGTVEILRDAEGHAAGTRGNRSTTMEVQKLSRQGNGAAAVEAPRAIKGWGKPAAPVQEQAQETTEAPRATFGRRADAVTTATEQKAAITAKLSRAPQAEPAEEVEPVAERAKAAFSSAVRNQLEAPKGEADQMAKEVDDIADGKAAPERRRRTKADIEAEQKAEARQAQQDAYYQRCGALESAVKILEVRPDIDATAVVEIAKELLAFLNGAE